jgi:hypothetical protein
MKMWHVGMAIGVGFCITEMAVAQPFVFRPENGHWYRAVVTPQGMTWDEARAAANAQNGYLACIADAAENSFVYNLVNAPEFWRLVQNPLRMFGPWIGGFQVAGSPEPRGGWSWVDGSPFVYTRWETNEPNNFGGMQEDRIHFFALGTQRDLTWNDIPNASPQKGYVVEVDCAWVLEQPQSRFVCPGSPVTLQFNAGAVGTVSFQWLRNGEVIPGATGNRLIFASTTPANTGSYRCELTAACGTVRSTEAMLVVCRPDINCSGSLDFFDYLDFVDCYGRNESCADYNGDGQIDFFDYLDFALDFARGCE